MNKNIEESKEKKRTTKNIFMRRCTPTICHFNHAVMELGVINTIAANRKKKKKLERAIRNNEVRHGKGQ